MLATEQPQLGMMETDWAENRAEIPQDFFRKHVGKYIDIFYSTYKRDKFRTRIERGAEPGTTEIYISHRGMEQVPTTARSTTRAPAGFAWAVMPPNPELEAEMLSRLMMRFGTPRAARRARPSAHGRRPPPAPDRARVEKSADGTYKLYRRRSVRPRVAPRRPGARPRRLHGGRPRPLAGPLLRALRRSRCDMSQQGPATKSWLAKLQFWKTDEKDKPEQYRIVVAEVGAATAW